MTLQSTRSEHAVAVGANHDLADLGVRELVAALAQVEDELRRVPFMVRRHGMMVVNPEVAPLLARERAVSTQLSQRRASWSSPHHHVPRGASASWPAPPWT